MKDADSPRRRRFKVVLLVIGLVGLTGLAWWYETRPPKVIVFISIDTLRRDHVSAYAPDGATPPVRTPTLDAIARAGVRFDAAEAPSPLTRPSHQTMFTGLWPPEHGVRDNHSLPLPPRDARSFETLAETLSDDGWQCAAFVSAQPLSSQFGLNAGFETYDEPDLSGRTGGLAFGERPANATVDRVVSWFESERDEERPLFLWVHLFDPHRPYAPPAHFVSSADERSASARYAGEVAFVDAEIRRLRDVLSARGIDEESATFVVVGDHGEGLGEHGESTHGWLVRQSTLAVPLLMAGPDIPAGRSVPNVVRLVDLRSTLLEAAGVRDAAPDAGTSLESLMEGDADAHGGPRPAYAESLQGYRECGWAQTSSLRADRWKLIDVGPRRELYDLLEDPNELADLAATRPDDVARLLAALDTFRTRASLAERRDAGSGRQPFGYGVIVEPERVGAFLDPTTNGTLRAVVDSMALVERIEHGRQLIQGRAWDRATALFDEVIRVDPKNPSAPFWRAYATFEQFRSSSTGDASPDDAARFAAAAWELGAKTVATRDLAVMAMSFGRTPAAALGFAERSYETVPPTVSSRHAEAHAHHALGAWEASLDRLEDAIELLDANRPERGVAGIGAMLEWFGGADGAAAGVPAESAERARELRARL